MIMSSMYIQGRNSREENVEKLRVKVQQCEETLGQQQVLIANHEEKVSKALQGARRMQFFTCENEVS